MKIKSKLEVPIWVVVKHFCERFNVLPSQVLEEDYENLINIIEIERIEGREKKLAQLKGSLLNEISGKNGSK